MGGMAVSTRAGEVYTYSTSLHQVRPKPFVPTDRLGSGQSPSACWAAGVGAIR